jgi:hypothetical protein
VRALGPANSINFISNDRLQTALAGTTATPAQVAEAVRVNTESRLRALKIGLLIMAGVAMLAIVRPGDCRITRRVRCRILALGEAREVRTSYLGQMSRFAESSEYKSEN